MARAAMPTPAGQPLVLFCSAVSCSGAGCTPALSRSAAVSPREKRNWSARSSRSVPVGLSRANSRQGMIGWTGRARGLRAGGGPGHPGRAGPARRPAHVRHRGPAERALQLAQRLDELGEVLRRGGGPPPGTREATVGRHGGAGRDGGGNRRPQSSWVVVVTVQVHPGRHDIGGGANPLGEQHGLAESRRCAHGDDIGGVVEVGQQLLANDELVRNRRRGDLGARHRRHNSSLTGTELRAPSSAGPNQAACRWAHLTSDRAKVLDHLAPRVLGAPRRDRTGSPGSGATRPQLVASGAGAADQVRF